MSLRERVVSGAQIEKVPNMIKALCSNTYRTRLICIVQYAQPLDRQGVCTADLVFDGCLVGQVVGGNAVRWSFISRGQLAQGR
jgi:hypothetical protein